MSAFDSRQRARVKALLAERAQGMRHAGTHAEQHLWQAIRGSALGSQFRRQVPLTGHFIADFVASEVRLIVEVDGAWHTRWARARIDARRDKALARMGFTVLRIPAPLVESHLMDALQRIRNAIATARTRR
jgi:very-short-patch-repair endonuclease